MKAKNLLYLIPIPFALIASYCTLVGFGKIDGEWLMGAFFFWLVAGGILAIAVVNVPNLD